METEKNGKLPFLDVLVCSKPNLITSVYRKPTYTGLLTNFFSFTPSKYKNDSKNRNKMCLFIYSNVYEDAARFELYGFINNIKI